MMRPLAARLLSWTVLTLALSTAFAGALLLVVERAQLAEETTRSSRLLARAAQVSIENALRDEQPVDVDELLDRLEIEEAGVELFVTRGRAHAPWLGADDTPGTITRAAPLLDRAWAEGAASGEIDVPGLGLTHVQALLLRPLDGEAVGVVVFARPTTRTQADMRSTLLGVSAAVVGFAITVSAALLAALRREVLDPLRAVALATTRLGEDLNSPLGLPSPQSHELHVIGEALGRLRDQLRRSRDAAAEAEQQRAEAEQRLREADKLVRVGQLAASLAHEIGSPLQVLVGRALMLASSDEQPPEVRRQAQLIAGQAERITRIVARLQDVVRRRPHAPAPVDLAEPVGQVLWLLETEARRRGVRLCVTPPAGTRAERMVQCDADELQQLGLNLILNGLQATPPGGEVRVAVYPHEEEVCMLIADTGHGITEEVRTKLFEPLFTTRGGAGGTGLGLSVVKAIADRHQARVTVDSAPGAGARFAVHFPRLRR